MALSRQPRTTVKCFYRLIGFGVITYIVLALYMHHSQQMASELKIETTYIRDVVLKKSDYHVKFVLFDRYSHLSPSVNGIKLYEDYQCQQNCYITNKKEIMKNFDAVVVNVIDIAHMKLERRSNNPLYVLYAMEPSDRVPIQRTDVDHFFDYTWSYKLSSDIKSPFFTVHDLNGTNVAPSPEPQWSMRISKSSLNENLAARFKTKTKAVAMVVKSCWEHGNTYARTLKRALSSYSRRLDTLGCLPHFNTTGEIISSEYFFVLVTIDSESQDYVTDKVLEAYENNAVPIIKAKADLSKFLPPGSYIDANLHKPKPIASIVDFSIRNMNTYRSFFKWTNFYTFRRRREFEGVCQLCSVLYSERRSSRINLREWWSKGRR